MTFPPPPLRPPRRVLLGPGPSEIEPSVLRSLAEPTLGHLDPRFLAIMDETAEMLRAVFGTRNRLTVPMSGTGSAGMEAAMCNLVEPGDRVLVGVNGVFGARLAEVARRAGGAVTEVEGEWGRALDPEAVRRAAQKARPNLLAVVHAETSTGVLQPLSPLREIADEHEALFLVDCVTSLGGVPVDLDERRIDAAYSGTQKCLSCPPGLAPLSFSERAVERLGARKHPVPSWYLDLTLIGSYWGGERTYHHTAPINMIYGLHEALRVALEEGLEERYARHARNARAFRAGLEALGLELLVPEGERLDPLTSIRVPEGVDEARVRSYLLESYSMEIGGGLGPLKGKVWRVGLMGAGARRRNVELCLVALTAALREQGFAPRGDGLAAAAAARTG